MSEIKSYRMYVAREIAPGIMATVGKIPEIWLDYTQEQMVNEVAAYKENHPEEFPEGATVILVEIGEVATQSIKRATRDGI
jgi:hypothetical protein